MAKNTYYITTAIDYPNGSPHIGHLYEKILADTYARWHRYMGRVGFFLTGTDENGQKLLKSAQASANSDTMAFVDQNVALFKELCHKAQISHDDFIRTTEARHVKHVQEFWQRLGDDIYFDRYSGNYCLACENFYSDKEICPEHNTKLEYVEEDGYFFKMSRYQDWIMDHIKTNKSFIFPRASRSEILSRLEMEPLRDLSLSRPNKGWGIEVPGDGKHVIYTWFDALLNYVSALDTPEKKSFWPANVHVIGKDIAWFHTVIWPIMLHAVNDPLPHHVMVHGMILAEDGKKMSKSLGNVVSPDELLGVFPNDLIRYYFCRAIGSGQDGAFVQADMIERHNKELANDFGNLCQRVIKFVRKKFPEGISADGTTKHFDLSSLATQVDELMHEFEHTKALDLIWAQIHKVNAFLNEHEPWRIKDDPAKVKDLCYSCLYAIRSLGSVLSAFLPEASAKVLVMFGLDSADATQLVWDAKAFNFESEPEVLFQKIEVTCTKQEPIR
jgi:methionyl-tRNA synthetase